MTRSNSNISSSNQLTYRHLGIDTHHEYVVYMRKDCEVCRSEGFEALTRLSVQNHHKEVRIIATLNVMDSNWLGEDEVGLSESARNKLGVKEGAVLTVSHMPTITSLSHVRGKMYGHPLQEDALRSIIEDIIEGNYSNIHLSAFLTTCAGDRLDIVEIVGLTKAMVDTGKKLSWNQDIVVDKHCVGGLPGNRTTPLVVAILASAGLTIPKTSSRAITSPAGTADMMEVLTEVNLELKQVKEVVEKEKGCIIWGDAIQLSPADDILVRVERALDIDSEGQMIASVLAKKAAAGSTHVVIDVPVGPTAKVRDQEAALKLKYYFSAVGMALGIKVKVVITDGTQPVGQGIGPALEAKDVLAIAKREKDAPKDLEEKITLLAGILLEEAGITPDGEGIAKAQKILDSGQAMEKLQSICQEQGRFSEPGTAKYQHEIKAKTTGRINGIDNRKLANVAKLAGAPSDAEAGVKWFRNIGEQVETGDLLYTIHSQSKGELQYAIDFIETTHPIIEIKRS